MLFLEKSEVAPSIREFLCRNFLFTDQPFPLGDEASLLQEGITDSLGIMELVTFVETRYGISVADSDLAPENFDSIAKLSAFILRNAVHLPQYRSSSTIPCQRVREHLACP